MNLKLIQPEYLSDKKRVKIENCLFDEYFFRSKHKKAIKGGLGNNNLEQCHHMKKYYEINAVEHQYNMNTIIKRFKETFGLKRNNKETLKNKCFNSRRCKQSESDTHTANKGSVLVTQEIHDSNSLSTQKKQSNTQHIAHHSREKSLLKAINHRRSLSLTSKDKKIIPNDCLKIIEGKMFIKKNHSTRNDNINKYFYPLDNPKQSNDKYFLLENLNQKFDFFKKEATFSKENRLKMFQNDQNKPLYHSPLKPSLQRIKIMILRDKKKISINF